MYKNPTVLLSYAPVHKEGKARGLAGRGGAWRHTGQGASTKRSRVPRFVLVAPQSGHRIAPAGAQSGGRTAKQRREATPRGGGLARATPCTRGQRSEKKYVYEVSELLSNSDSN